MAKPVTIVLRPADVNFHHVASIMWRGESFFLASTLHIPIFFSRREEKIHHRGTEVTENSRRKELWVNSRISGNFLCDLCASVVNSFRRLTFPWTRREVVTYT